MKYIFVILMYCLILSSCERPVKNDEAGMRTVKYLYGTVRDFNSGDAIDSVLVAEKNWSSYGANELIPVRDSYFDSLSAVEAPLALFEDSCDLYSYTAKDGTMTLKYEGWVIYYRDTGEFIKYTSFPLREVLFAYKKGYYIWRFDATSDTLTAVPIPGASPGYIKEYRLSTIRLQKK